MPPKNAVFIPGEAIRLPCVAIGVPAPNITRDLIHFRLELGDFKDAETKIVTATYGKSIQLPCNVPLGYPPPVVTWQTEKNSQIEYIKETNRRATDINGYLYITAVEEEDHDTLYTCVANNEVMRHQKDGPSYRIKVYGQPTNFPLEELYRTPRTEVAVVGDKLQLKCIFSGYPTPEYTWFKDGVTPINLPNVVIQNLGTMLEINPVTLDAAGQYRCQGSNELTRTTRNAQYKVQVRVRPEFTEKPEDITVPVEGSVVFTCSASGVPAPQIRWTVNGGDPSTYLDGTRKVMRGNTMYLSNLTIKDSAVIQCNASNAFGYAFTNAYVNVMCEPPYFILPPQAELRAVDGHNVTLYCQTFSAPKAVISWAKDGRPINGGRYQSMPNGDLYISSVAITDSGVYECTATNPFGSRKASGRLYVRRRTNIVLAPLDTYVYEGQMVKFVCTAETDPMELENLKITWYKDNNLIQPEATPRIQPVWFDYSLVLSGAQPRDTGQYVCNASNGLDYATASASLLVQGRPEQPINVQINCVDFINDELALVSWYPGSDNYAPIMEYLVEYSTQYERDTWYPAEIFNFTGLVQSTSVKVILRPSIEYQFRIRTRNRIGFSLPSQPTTTLCSIPPRVPAVNPSELYVYGSLPNNLIIRWTTLPYIEHYGSSLGYILTVTCLNCVVIPRDAVNTTIIGNWRIDRITYTSFRAGASVYEIETYKQFKVTIQSRNEEGASTSPPTEATGYSGEAVPTIVPPTPTVVRTTPRGAELQWTAITESESAQMNGYFRGYRIGWCNAALNEANCETQKRYQDVLLRIPETPVLYTYRRRRSVDALQQPQPYHSNNMEDTVLSRYLPPSLRAYEQYSKGQNVTVPLSPVCHVAAKKNVHCPGTGLFPRAAQSRSVVGDAYEAVLIRVPRQTANKFVFGQTINYTLTGVPGATTIKLWSRILNTRFAGPMSATTTLTTLEDVPGPVGDLKAVIIGVNYVNITWNKPAEPNGNITGYEFEAMELNGLEMGYGFRYDPLMDGFATSYQMPRLKPNTSYRITVWALTSAGAGVDTFVDLRTLPSDVAPTAPNFVVTTIGVSNFTVIYEPSHTGSPGTVFFVQYRQPGKVLWLESQRTFINRQITVNNLSSDTSYEIRMIATNGGRLSTASAIRLVTTLGPPGPGGLAGESGTWFIIVCVLLIFFIAVIIILILLRRHRMGVVRKRAEGPAPDYQPLVTSQEYGQPEGVKEPPRFTSVERDNYSRSGYSGSEIASPVQSHREPESVDQWSPEEEGLSDRDHPLSRVAESEFEHEEERSAGDWDNDADVVSPQAGKILPLRSNEEEAEMEVDRSHVPSGSESRSAHYNGSRYRGGSGGSRSHQDPKSSRSRHRPPDDSSTKLVLKRFGEKSEVEQRMLSRMKWKTLMDTIGPSVCILFWFGTLLVRIFPKDLNENYYRIYYFISRVIWQVLVLPYLLVSFVHGIYLLLVLLDDTGFIHGETANKLFELFELLASDLENEKKLEIVNSLELVQLKYRCCGGTSHLDWLDINIQFADQISTTGLMNSTEDFNPWGQKSTSPFFPTSCCDRSQNIKCATSLLRPSDELTVYQMTYEAPVYKRDCAQSVYEHTYSELFSLIVFFSAVDILLHFIQMFAQIKSYFNLAPRYPCSKWALLLPPLQSKLTPPKMGSRRESTGSVVHRTGSITHMDGSRTHQDGSITKVDGTFVPIPDKLYHRSGSVTVRSGSRIHRTGSRSHTNRSRTHRTGSVTYADGTRVHRDQTISLGPGDTRDVCMKGEKVKVFFGSAGYISTEQILQACQGTHLLAQPSYMQQKSLRLRSRYIAGRMKIGWVLRGVDRQYSSVLHRVPVKKYRSIAPTQASGFRHFLRIHLPMIEAIIYADGNSVIETEANAYYRSFCVYLIRGLLFLLLGFLAVKVLLPFVLSTDLNTPLLSFADKIIRDEGEMKRANQRVQDMSSAINEEVCKQTSLFLYTTIMVATLMSRRVRTVLVLALPGLGLTVGWVYLSNEMMHAALIGPVTNTRQNLLSITDTVMCLAEASHNVTRDFDQINVLSSEDDEVKPEYADVIGEDRPDFRNTSLNFMNMSENLRVKLLDALEEYANLWPSFNTMMENYFKAIEALKWAPKLSTCSWSVKKYEEYRKKLPSAALSEEERKHLSESIQKGEKLEGMLVFLICKICNSYQFQKRQQCKVQSDQICVKLSELFKGAAYQPTWYSDACSGKNYQSACPLEKYEKFARTQCRSELDVIGVEQGTVAYVIEAYEVIKAINESLQVEEPNSTGLSIKLGHSTNWMDDSESDQQEISYYYPPLLEGLFYTILLVSTLLKLLFLRIILNAHDYISYYILDPDYDNIYVGRLFEIIDAKRLFEGKENLLPLKSMETRVFWRRQCYTLKQVQQIVIGLAVTFFYGLGVRLLFSIDYYFYETTTFLIDLTSGYHGIRRQLSELQFTGTDARVLGSGIFHQLTAKLLLNLGRLKDINLNYDRNFCSPYLFQTHQSHMGTFGTAWFLQTVLIILGPYLLRSRHNIAAFFYPSRSRSRVVRLYNSMLIERRHHMTICRNLIVHWVREGRLQREARRRSEPSFLTFASPRLARMLALDKQRCIICQDLLPPGPDLLICPLDHTATCQQCASMVLKSNVCIVCLDRNPKRLFKERRKLQRAELKRY
ncbi:unnamed protein product [Calicophoron daubneyi]|uniref:Uncharacterized protein n=1 Tax=Calicophoron daubneyi TaxID=300641 RepID=A0AAV2TAP4_CALDB